jgi:hypothetical protein
MGNAVRSAAGIMKKRLRRFLTKRYLGARIYHHWEFRRRLRGRDRLFVVYQMGKVGSSSVAHGLQAALGPAEPVFHVHTLCPRRIRFNEVEYFGTAGPRTWFRPAPRRISHLLEAHFLRAEYRRNFPGKRWQVVTLVRDPVARNVSAFFQIGDLLLPEFSKKLAAGEWRSAALTRSFLNDFSTHDVPLTWMDAELGSVLGVDVYDRPFAADKGYRIIRGSVVDLLILKIERLSEVGEEAIGTFLGRDDVRLLPVNLASDKEYANAYRDFRSRLVLPEDYLNAMYESRFARHFYSQAEIDGFRRRWRGTGATA